MLRDYLQYRANKRQINLLGKEVCHSMKMMANTEARIERYKVAQAELPAGNLARASYRGNQLADMANAAAAVFAAAVAIQTAMRQLRQEEVPPLN